MRTASITDQTCIRNRALIHLVTGTASVHRLSLQLAVKAELLGKVTMEQVKGMQRDLVVHELHGPALSTKWESAAAAAVAAAAAATASRITAPLHALPYPPLSYPVSLFPPPLPFVVRALDHAPIVSTLCLPLCRPHRLPHRLPRCLPLCLPLCLPHHLTPHQRRWTS
jgi:hypothetical protein